MNWIVALLLLLCGSSQQGEVETRIYQESGNVLTYSVLADSDVSFQTNNDSFFWVGIGENMFLLGAGDHICLPLSMMSERDYQYASRDNEDPTYGCFGMTILNDSLLTQ